jgi:hypothetical protein
MDPASTVTATIISARRRIANDTIYFSEASGCSIAGVSGACL